MKDKINRCLNIIENANQKDFKLKPLVRGQAYSGNTVPLIFERNYNDNSFDCKHFLSGDNTRVDIEDVIYNKELVNSYMNDYIKERLENKNIDMFK